MASYLLVENRQIIHLGPMEWRQRFFQSELNDLEVEYQVPPVEQGYIKINDNFEFIPVVAVEMPEYDMFEELVGPTWTYDNNQATGTYTKQPGNIDAAKGNMKSLVADKRYQKENTPFTMTIQNQLVTVDASRDNRNIFIQKYQLMADTDTVQWKFPETWLTLTKQELGSVVLAGANHIQTQFDWEKSIIDQIDATSDVATLKSILEVINGA